MITYKRICVEDYLLEDAEGKQFKLDRGKEYLTGKEEDGKVMVFGQYWVSVPSTYFGGERRFT